MSRDTAADAQTPDTEARTWSEVLGWAGPIAGLIVLVVFLSNTQWYGVFKAIHVLAAIVWVGGGAAITLVAWRASRARDDEQLIQIARQAEWLGTRVFVPSSLVAGVMGFVLMAKGDWAYGEFWVLFGLVAWGVSFLVGAVFLGPESGRLAKLMEAKGPDHPETQARVKRILAVARADVVLIALVAADMVAKPFLF
jgi:uncharacterized membrane protein